MHNIKNTAFALYRAFLGRFISSNDTGYNPETRRNLFLQTIPKTSRRFVTLVEMMVVIFIIGLIVSVVGFRYQGSLEKGKVFKTETSIDKVETFLSLRIAENPSLNDNIERNWQEVIRSDPFAKDPEALIKDGWGETLQVEVDDQGNIHVWSRKLDEYKKKSR